MHKEIESFFEKEKIEYFAAFSYADCSVIAPRIMEREAFSPQSVIMFLIPYYAGEAKNLSVYSAPLDYHIYIKKIEDSLISLLSSIYPDNHFKGYGDHSPIDERLAALDAGLGIRGDNGLLINEKYGTYIFIAEIISDIPPEIIGAVPKSIPGECEHCGACRASCPTGSLSDSCAECLSAITQRKGELTEKEVDLMKKIDTVWGCDICQRICPHNRLPQTTPIGFFWNDRIDFLTLKLLDSLSDEDFMKRAFSFRKRKTIERNLRFLGY